MANCTCCDVITSSVGSSAPGELPAKRPAPKVVSAMGKPHPSPNIIFLDTEEKLKRKRVGEMREKKRGRKGEGGSGKYELQERATWNCEEDMFVSTYNWW